MMTMIGMMKKTGGKNMNYNQQRTVNKNTVIAYCIGLLMGGLLVWVFSGITPSRLETRADQYHNNVQKSIDACLAQSGIPRYRDGQFYDCEQLYRL